MEALKEALAAQPQEKAPKETAAEAEDDSSAALQAETKAVIGHGILAGTYLAEYRDSLK